MMNWWFLDSCSGDKFFRIDEAQEHLYYVNDISDQELYITEEREDTGEAANDVTKAEPYEDDIRRVSTSSSSRLSQESGDDRENENPMLIVSGVANEQMGDNEPTLSETSDPAAPEAESEMADTEDNDEDSEENSEGNNYRLQIPLPQKRASISSLTIDESTMDIITASKMGNLNRIVQLHTEGHSLMDKDSEGRTALHHAAFIGNVDVVRYLAAYAPISVLDAQDDILYHTALHRAATRRDMVVCSILVSAGASLDLKDKQGNTAQQLAVMVGAKKLAEYLGSVTKSVIL